VRRLAALEQLEPEDLWLSRRPPEEIIEFDPATGELRTLDRHARGRLFPWGRSAIAPVSGLWLIDDDPSKWTVVLAGKFTQWRNPDDPARRRPYRPPEAPAKTCREGNDQRVSPRGMKPQLTTRNRVFERDNVAGDRPRISRPRPRPSTSCVLPLRSIGCRRCPSARRNKPRRDGGRWARRR
jgi:hypothetical protein